MSAPRSTPPALPGAHPASTAGSIPAPTDDLLATIDTMSSVEIDALPFGMMQLDLTGRILKYNTVESRLSGLAQAEQIGKAFFTEVAPCTQVQDFYGRFTEGVAARSLDASFQFHFPFKQHPRDVTVRLFYSPQTQSVWVMVSDGERKAIR